jgi:TolA-binding protein
MIRLAAVLVWSLVLVGCANLWQSVAGSAPDEAAPREERESRQVVELIGYAQRVAGLQADEQQRELNASSQMFSKDRGVYGRVRLALLLSLPGTPFSDESKAVGLLDPLVSKEAAGPMQQFAGLLHTQINERVREQRRATQLKEQLDALKDVERKIIEREQARPR